MKRILVLLVGLLLVPTAYAWDRMNEVSREKKEIRCELCGQSSTYYHVIYQSIWAYDSIPPDNPIGVDEGIDEWVTESWITAHSKCLHQLISNFLAAQYEVFIKSYGVKTSSETTKQRLDRLSGGL